MSKESILNDIRNDLKESVDFFAHRKDMFTSRLGTPAGLP